MIFEYRNAPMKYIEGIPAYLAGEWAGKKSCKFGPTRKVIRPLTEGVIFSENEPPLIPKRRNLSQGPSKEYEFKPCIKMVSKPEINLYIKRESLKVIRPTITEGKDRPEKRHHFIYKDEYIRQLQIKQNQNDSKSLLNEEFRLNNKQGFSKKIQEKLPNHKLLGLTFVNDDNKFNETQSKKKGFSFSKTGKDLVMDINTKNIWQKKEDEKIKLIQMEHENLKRDENYVKTLANWDRKNLSKIK